MGFPSLTYLDKEGKKDVSGITEAERREDCRFFGLKDDGVFNQAHRGYIAILKTEEKTTFPVLNNVATGKH